MNKKHTSLISIYPMPSWAVQQLIRASGLVEDVCDCGIGHPNQAYIAAHPKANTIHGCCGCCTYGHPFEEKEH